MSMKETNTLYTLYKMIAAVDCQINVSFFCNSFEFTATYDGEMVIYDQVRNSFNKFKKLSKELFDRVPKRTFRSVVFDYINGTGIECRVYFDIANKPAGRGD